MSSSSGSSETATAADLQYLETVRQGLVELGLDEDWDVAATFLSTALSLDRIAADDALARAWRWRSWAVAASPMTRRFVKPLPPNLTQLQHAVTWWRQGPLAALPEEVLMRGVREHPDLYLVTPEQLYHQAVAAAPEEYHCDADTFLALLVDMPSVLGCTYNCVETGCNSNCGNCWVSFQTVLKQSKR